jgi:hypothetical protein
VQAGGDAAHERVGQLVGQRPDERVTAAAVLGPLAAQVAVELAAGEEVGEGVRLDAIGLAVG